MNAKDIANKYNWNMPTKCPCCGQDLSLNDNMTRLYCSNPSCKQKVNHLLNKFLSKLNVLCIGPKMVEKFVDDKHIKDLSGFLILRNYMPEVLGKNGEKALDNLNKALQKPIKFSSYLSLFNLSTGEIGYDEKKLKFVDELKELTIDNIEKALSNDIEGLSEKSRDQILQLIKDKWIDIENSKKYFNFSLEEEEPSTGKFVGMSFCFTGKMEMKRGDMEKLAIDNGGKVAAVTKDLTYLVCADPSSNSGKMKAAKDKGVKVISEQEFLKMVQ